MTLLPFNNVLIFCFVSIVDLLMLLCLPVVPSSAQQSHRSSYVVISTKLGQVRGLVVDVTNGNESCEENVPVTTQFLGVPYALPPVGRLRFQEPQKNNGWILQGVLNATVSREHCPVKQCLVNVEEHGLPTETVDNVQTEWNAEDCLYMNIYVPGNLSSTAYIDAMELPVLVIFNEEGPVDISTQKDALSRLACYGQIVIIDLSYRLGVLSYLSISGEKVTMGNNGFQDQRLAMFWIWDNVREFGGNPEEITILAEREASVSLGFHVLHPDSRGLFARAVMHSGTPIKEYFEHNYSELAAAVANAVGCSDLIPENSRCLQSVALHQLLKAAEAAESNHTSRAGQTSDHLTLVPSPVLESLNNGLFSQVELLIGSSEHDGLCLVQERNELPSGISKTSMETFMRNALRSRYRNASTSEQTLRIVLDAVLFEYSSSCSVNQNLTETVARFLTDMLYRAPAEWTARLASRQDSSVYFYLISSKNCSCSGLKSLLAFTECGQKPVNRLAKNVMDALVNFVRKGNPNPLNELKNWKPFTERERHFLRFTDEEMQLKQSVRQRKMTFWNEYFPLLLDSDLDSCPPVDDTLPDSSFDNRTDEDAIKISLVICFLVVLALLLLLVVFILMRRHRSHQFPSRHCACCFRCCSTGQRQNHHDLIVAAVAGPDDDDLNLHPLPYNDDSAWS